jgi:hypothetical protein
MRLEQANKWPKSLTAGNDWCEYCGDCNGDNGGSWRCGNSYANGDYGGDGGGGDDDDGHGSGDTDDNGDYGGDGGGGDEDDGMVIVIMAVMIKVIIVVMVRR